MDNPRLDLAEQFVLYTRKNIFLTGRAGTGKTTFLHNVLKKTKKNFMIVAPTGVAAINAGGITIHSLFQFPLTAFTPDNQIIDFNIATNRHGLAKHLRYRSEKKKLFYNLDLLVIDEISMVRADLLDAIDFALRRVKRIDQPFGNIQLLVIGDLFQLAPVVKPPAWNILRLYYTSPYFFDALAWKNSQPITIELTKIYRQSNQEFIDILNRMRYGKSTTSDIERLNQNHQPTFKSNDKKYITLTTHNNKADQINSSRMAALTTKVHKYKAEITDQFNEHAYPADYELSIKAGAQLMFIRNDSEGRYYNGKLVEVVSAKQDTIEVKSITGEQFSVEPVTWENKKYELNKETNEIQEKLLGSFKQYPLRLAWAITVHKSQGLTFDHMIVDLGNTFASGQAYVALSRCTSLDGLVLLSKMNLQNVMVNDQIVSYHDRAPKEEKLSTILEVAKLRFANEELTNTFALDNLKASLEDWMEEVAQRDIPDRDMTLKGIREIIKNLSELETISKKFQGQLHHLISQYSNTKDIAPIKGRVQKAVDYFTENIYLKIITPIHFHRETFAYKAKVRKYLAFVRDLQLATWAQMDKLYQVSFLGIELYQGDHKYKKENLKSTKSAATSKKPKKGATIEDTLALFKTGKSIAEIAEIRSLVISTIEGHIAKLIAQNKVSIYEALEESQVEKIAFYILQDKNQNSSEIKNKIPFEVTYSQIRMVRAHLDLTRV